MRTKLLSLMIVFALTLGVIAWLAPSEAADFCCVITQIDAKSGLVTARDRTTRTFQFKVSDLNALHGLKVGQGIYADFKTMQVSLDGKAWCCVIVSQKAPPAVVALSGAFNPKVHGFHFQNTQFPGDILIDVPGYGTVNFGHTSYALCGGMSYAALDTFNLRGQAPPDTSPPASGTPIRSYIYRRQQDSFRYDNGFLIVRMAEWMVYPDKTSMGITGVHVLTHREFLNNIRPELDAGRKVPIGIVKVHVDRPEAVKQALTHNHQSIAIGYEHHEGIDEPHWDVHIYDPNFPDTVQTLHTATDHHDAYQTQQGQANATDKFRGFFRAPYGLERPPWVTGH